MRIEVLENGVVIVTVLGGATVVILLPGGFGAVVTGALNTCMHVLGLEATRSYYM